MTVDRLGIDMLGHLVALDHDARRDLLLTFEPDDFEALWRASERELGSRFGIWQDDPVGFVRYVLGDWVSAKQAQILQSVVDHQRTVVPAGPALGKTHIAARAVAWWIAVYPVGSAKVVTTAPRWRQVVTLLWPHINQVHAQMRGLLPGKVDMAQWKSGNTILAHGFSAPDWDENAVQGIHAPHLLVLVDEGGGISHTLGRSFTGLLTGHSRILVVGNPPTDEQGTWFESIYDQRELWNPITIRPSDSPNLTDEDCPPEVAAQMVDQRWIDDVVVEFGEDHPYYTARVLVEFPRGGTNQVIPWGWIENAAENNTPQASTWVRLGVDVASDGGDELVIARAEGFRLRIVHHSSGAVNANAVDVAGKVLDAIRDAQLVATQLGSTRPVRVKVDADGVGWGVLGILQRWGTEGVHSAEIVGVQSGESANDSERFANKRAEMWWTLRTLVQPRRRTATAGPSGVLYDPPAADLTLLAADRRVLAQMAAPRMLTNTQGRTQIERKKDMKARGVGSPDRAEGVALAVYEPEVQHRQRLERPNATLPRRTSPANRRHRGR